jgi:arylformamidase
MGFSIKNFNKKNMCCIVNLMKISLVINDQTFQIESENPMDISIPLEFNALQPNIYGVSKATAKAYEDEHFVGDTRYGGSCNFENLALNTHCNGTHTECVGHITNERIPINASLQDAFMLANLITVVPENSSETQDSYSVKLDKNDWLITKKSIKTGKGMKESREALIVRTSPNDLSKKNRDYAVQTPPFFSIEAMQYIVELGVKHLLVDIPSLDKSHDEGKLFTHRIFWNVEQGSFVTNPQTKMKHTVTEMIYVSDEIKDGEYLLNLQIAPFVSDASPSRPILFNILKIV